MVAEFACAVRELGDLPECRQRLRELAQRAVATLAGRRGAAVLHLATLIRAAVMTALDEQRHGDIGNSVKRLATATPS